MSQKFKSDIETQAGLIDSFGFTGTAGQVLSSTGTKTEWITPPQSPGGGGSSQVFYFNGGTASSVGGYYQMSPVANTGTGADFTINADGYIASFLTDVASPNQLNIPAGNWNFEIYFSASSSGGSPSFYVELYKYSSGGVFTLIASSSAAPEGITNGTTIDAYFTPLSVPTTTLLATDRLAVRVYVTHSGRTITMHTQNGHLSEVITTFSTGLTALNGLTEQVQYFSTGTAGTDFNIASAVNTHTFNLPTASATNRGALSSVDWTTFNSKANASGTTNYVSKFTGATTLGNSQIFDNGTDVGIGTTTPGTKLQINVAPTGTQDDGMRVTDGTRIIQTNIVGNTYNYRSVGPNETMLYSTGNPLNIVSDGQPIKFTAGTSESMRITSGGNVGIGTPTPGEKLDVYGVIRGIYTADPGALGAVTAKLLSYSPSPYGIVFRGYSSGAHSIQVQRESNVAQVYPLGLQPLGGSVGIGTITPAKLLDVNGDALINTLTVGRGTGNKVYNTVLGYQSLFNNTTGDNNVAIGYQTLLNNTTGGSNVGIGVAALKSNTTGVDNTAIGTVSLFSNTAGEGNTAIGYYAGNQSTGNKNIFIGYYAGSLATTSELLTVIGGYFNPSKLTLNESQTLSIEKPDLAVNAYLGEASGLPHIWAPETKEVSASSVTTLVQLERLLYSSIFIEYNLEDTAGNARAGTIKVVWNQDASVIKVTEDNTDDIGNTSNYLISFDTYASYIDILLINNGGETVYCNTTSRILIRPTIQIL